MSGPVREAFEAWSKMFCLALDRRPTGTYESMRTHDTWCAYVAGRVTVEADLDAMMAKHDAALKQRDYNAEVITQRNAMLSRSAAELADMTAERNAALARERSAWDSYKAEHAIVARIWVQLGSPTYGELNGRSIYDLIDAAIAKGQT